MVDSRIGSRKSKISMVSESKEGLKVTETYLNDTEVKLKQLPMDKSRTI